MSLNHAASAPVTFGNPLKGLFADVAAWCRSRKVYRDTYTELALLSDRELDDLGLSVADFHRIAESAARDA